MYFPILLIYWTLQGVIWVIKRLLSVASMAFWRWARIWIIVLFSIISFVLFDFYLIFVFFYVYNLFLTQIWKFLSVLVSFLLLGLLFRRENSTKFRDKRFSFLFVIWSFTICWISIMFRLYLLIKNWDLKYWIVWLWLFPHLNLSELGHLGN